MDAYTELDRPESIAIVFVEAWNRRDAGKLASLFEEDADFVNVVGLWWHDRASIRRAHAYGFERIFPRSTLRVSKLRTRRLSSTIAVVHARMSLAEQSAVEGVAIPKVRTNILSFVVREVAGSWRCVSAQNTDVVPGAETNVVDAEGKLRAVSYRAPRERRRG